MSTTKRRARPATVALVVVTLVAGCGHKPAPRPSPTATPKPPSDEQRITRLLERRARALRDGRVRAFAATSLPRRRAGAREAARRVAGLGLRRPHYMVDRIAVAGRRARIRARLAYGVRGVTGDFGSGRVLLARKRGGRWLLDRALGERDAEPWEVDDYARVVSPHFVVFSPTDIVPPSDALEVGYMRLRDLLPDADLRRRYLVVVARDGEHARRLTRKIAGLESLSALTDTQVRIEGPAERPVKIGSQRLIVVESVFRGGDVMTQQAVITHELTHAALAPVTSGRVPAWLTEGIAQYVSADDRRYEYSTLSTVPTLAGLSAPDAIARVSGERQRAAYAAASNAAFAIADRYGRDKLFALYRAYLRPGLRGERGDPELTDRAVRRVLHTSLTELQRRLG